MAPFVTIDNTDDFDFSPSAPLPTKSSNAQRTLLLAPPSVASHPETLNRLFETYDRNVTDLQMLDRLSMGLVTLPESTYDVILLLSDADGRRTESQSLLSRDVIGSIASSLKTDGRLKSQDGTFGNTEGAEKTEAILAGLVSADDGMSKPEPTQSVSVPLRFGKKKTNGAVQPPASDAVPLALNGKRKVEEEAPKPAGVGFVDFSDDLDNFDEADLIDDDELLTDADRAPQVLQPIECRPKAGKRRRACKDCTCGMKEQLEAEDAAKRSDADKKLSAMKLDADDLAEVDFTVQGKVGSCGNCALGDAFRCDGCPYIGLPAFKPGEEVRLLNNDIQL